MNLIMALSVPPRSSQPSFPRTRESSDFRAKEFEVEPVLLMSVPSANPRSTSASQGRESLWIPAFAGMTTWRGEGRWEGVYRRQSAVVKERSAAGVTTAATNTTIKNRYRNAVKRNAVDRNGANRN